MPKTTPHYLLTFYQAGDFYSATDDLDRVTVIDNQLESLSSLVGEGVLSGWTIESSGTLEILVRLGSGFIENVLHRTFTIKYANVYDEATNSILLQSKMLSGTSGFQLEVQGPFSGISSSIYLDSIAPSAPTNFSSVASSYDTINLYWDANPETDFSYYEIQRDTNAAFSSPTLIGSPSLNGVFPGDPYQDDGLSSETLYYYRIRAVDKSGNAGFYITHSGFPIPVTTPADTRQPGEVTNLSLYPGNSQVSMTFDPSPTNDVTKYIITVEKLDTDGSVLSSSEIDNGLSETAQIIALNNASTYRFKVQSVRHPGTSDVRSNGIVAKTVPQNLSSPAAPTGLSAVAGVGSVTLSWTASTSPSGSSMGQKKNYRIRVIDPGSTQSAPIDVGLITSKTLNSYNQQAVVGIGPVTYFIDDVVYLFKVSTTDSFGNESGGVYVKSTTIDVTPPKNPRSLSATGGDTVVDIFWRHSQSTDVVAYDIYYDLGSGFVPAVGIDGRIGYVETYRVVGLPNGNPVTFRMRAIDDAGNISSGTNIVATPEIDTVPPSIPAFIRANPGDEHVTLTWAGVNDVDLSHFIVKRSEIVGDLDSDPNVNLEIVDGSEIDRNVGSLMTFLDPELKNGTVYMYSIQSVDLRGNASDFSGRTLVSPSAGINEAGPDRIESPANLSTVYGSGKITVSWDFDYFGAILVGPDLVFTVNIDAAPTAFNIFRSTDSLAGFQLVGSVRSSERSYEDSNLVGGTRYYYRVTAVRDNADILVDTGSIQPPNTVLLGTVVTNNGAIVSVTNSQRIVENIAATLTEETLDRLLVHRHLTKPINSVLVTASSLLSMVDIRDLASIDLSTLTLSTDANNYYQTVGTSLIVDDNTLYVISPNSVVYNLPFCGDFQVLVNGERPNAEFILDEDINAIRFTEPLKNDDVVIISGLGLTYYVPAQVDFRFRGFEINVNGTVASQALIDEQLQTIRFVVARAESDVVTVNIEPSVPDFGVQDGPKQISLSPDIVLNDFISINDRTFVSESGSFEEGDIVFALVDGEKTNLDYYVDYTNKSIIFDSAPPSGSSIAMEVRNTDEVTDLLDPDKIPGIDASVFKSGTFLDAQLPDISHEGRVRERVYPVFGSLSTINKYSYQAATGTTGTGTTVYAAYQTGEGSLMGLLLGTSRGLMRSVRSVFLASGDDASIVDDTKGVQFDDGDNPVLIARNATQQSGRAEGSYTLYDQYGAYITRRYYPCFTELDDGKVLLTGGAGPGGLGQDTATKNAYIYDPSNNGWTRVADMSKARIWHACALLPDGKVLVSGGEFYYFSGFVQVYVEAEIYSPLLDAWTDVGNMHVARSMHSITVINPLSSTSDVLVAGGRRFENTPSQSDHSFYNSVSVDLDSAERYIQSSATWTPTGSMNIPASGHLAFSDGGNVITDGFDARELYTSSTALWTKTDPVLKRQSDIKIAELDGPVKQFFNDSTGILLAVTRNTVYESRDNGENFSKMSGLESTGVVHRISETPDGTLFAATDLGIYEIIPELRNSSSWFQGGLIGAGTTETFDLQPIEATMLAATEIGVFVTDDGGVSWTKLVELDDVFNIERLSDGTILAQSSDEMYKSEDDGLTWELVSTNVFLDSATLMLARNLDLFVGTTDGLYVTTDASTFSLLGFDRNKNERENNVHCLTLVGDDVYVGYDNIIFSVDAANDTSIVGEFVGIVPTIRLNGTEVRSGFRYDTVNDVVIFETKTFLTAVVELASNYSLYQFSGGGWYAQNSNAVVRVFVNRVEQSGDGILTDARLGQFVFDNSLKKADVVTVSVSGTSLRNEGELFHHELEDKMEKEKGLPLSLGRNNTANLLQLGLGIEHNFFEHGLDRNQYYCLTGSYVDRSFNSFWDKSEFYIMGRKEYDVFNSTVDYSIESKQTEIGTSALVPLDTLDRSPQELWVGTDNGIFILNPASSFSVSESVGVGDDAAVRHMLEFDGDVWASTNQGLFVISDIGMTKEVEKNKGSGLPPSIYVTAAVNNLLLVGTEDAIYYADSIADPPFSVWFRSIFTELRDATEIEVTGTCNSMVAHDGIVMASIGRDLFFSTDGKTWERVFRFDADLKITITSMTFFAEMLFVGTNKGIYNDRGTSRTDVVQLTLEKIESTEDASQVHVNDLFAGTNELYMVGNTDQVYARQDEEWTKTQLAVSAAHSFVLTSGGRKVVLSNNQVFVE